jgi:hypothetical protein
VFRFIGSLLKLVLFAILGAALAAKFLLDSNADPSSEEIDLVNVLGGMSLTPTADPFYGGKVTTIIGGTAIDLREATPAPTGIDIDAFVLVGGLDLIVPDGWKVVFRGTTIAGGFDDATGPAPDDDAPQLRVGGVVAIGGTRVTNRPSLRVVS